MVRDPPGDSLASRFFLRLNASSSLPVSKRRKYARPSSYLPRLGCSCTRPRCIVVSRLRTMRRRDGSFIFLDGRAWREMGAFACTRRRWRAARQSVRHGAEANINYDAYICGRRRRRRPLSGRSRRTHKVN